MSISILFTAVGLILVFSGSFDVQPYTQVERVRVDSSRVYVNETRTLIPGSEMTYAFDSLVTNSSIMEISFRDGTGGPFRFRIVDIVINYTVISWERIRVNPVYWVPPSNTVFYFIFDNPYSTPAHFSIVIKEYYLKQVVDQKVTLYQPFLPQSYAAIGIGLIVVGILFDVSILGSEEISRYKEKLDRQIQNYQPPKD
jgi:hypothetical protein